jgi:hypothetical protein
LVAKELVLACTAKQGVAAIAAIEEVVALATRKGVTPGSGLASL